MKPAPAAEAGRAGRSRRNRNCRADRSRHRRRRLRQPGLRPPAARRPAGEGLFRPHRWNSPARRRRRNRSASRAQGAANETSVQQHENAPPPASVHELQRRRKLTRPAPEGNGGCRRADHPRCRGSGLRSSRPGPQPDMTAGGGPGGVAIRQVRAATPRRWTSWSPSPFARQTG